MRHRAPKKIGLSRCGSIASNDLGSPLSSSAHAQPMSGEALKRVTGGTESVGESAANTVPAPAP